MKLIYDPIEGQAVPDGLVEQVWEGIKNCDEFCTSTGLMLTRARLGYVRGEIQELVVKFEGKLISVNEYGNLDSWPPGLDDFSMNLLHQLIDETSKKTAFGNFTG